jgi:hypothetical protein
MRRMRDRQRAVLTSGMTLVLFTGTALAAGSGAGTTENDDLTLEAMAKRLADLEKQNDTLQGRVRELESADGELWLTEQRATEIRGIVTDVLADADTRASLRDSGATAGWDDGFFLQSTDGRFRLNVGGMVQARYQYSHIRANYDTQDPEFGQAYSSQDDAYRRFGWDIPHARLDFSGHVFGSDTTFRILGQFTNQRGDYFIPYTNPPQINSPDVGQSNGAFQLLDAWIAQQLGNGFSVRVGQFKLPFDLGWEIGIANQMTGDRTMTALHMGLGRSQGIELAYRGDDIRARLALSEGAYDGLFADYKLAVTNPANSPYYMNQSDLSLSSRMEWKLAGSWADFDRMTSPPGEQFGLLAGFGVHWQMNKVYLNPTSVNTTTANETIQGFPVTVSANNYNNWIGLTGDLTANFGGATVTASGYWHFVDGGATYLYGKFEPVTGNQDAFSFNPTFDVGTVQLFGASVYGSTYLTSDIEAFVGFDYMDMISGDLNALPGNGTSLFLYGAYKEPDPIFAITFGGTWYIDGEDLKFGVNCTYLPDSVSPNWKTPELGVRSTPSSDEFVFRAYFQLLF